MKKYLILITTLIVLYMAYDYAVNYKGSLYIPNDGPVQCFTKAENQTLWIDKGEGFEVFDLKGVNLGLGKPGEFATSYSIGKEEYLRWFQQIQDLGANTIRIYTMAQTNFYDAFYEYNLHNPEPLYLIQGVWLDDYMLNSRRSAFDKELYSTFLKHCKNVVDVIHGRHKSNEIKSLRTQHYTKDISPWVYGYIIGVEWEADLVAFTNETGKQLPQYEGTYLYTENAQNFEIFLAMIGDSVIQYETEKYGAQRSLAFSNWPTTCPLTFSDNISARFEKFSSVDVEHILSTDRFIGGQYASYHVYPYYPDFLYYQGSTAANTYLEYLMMLNEHHSMPVIISEFGVPSSRGMAAYEHNRELKRDQGHMSEKDQGEALVSMYDDIRNSGSAGAIAFIWQDEWFKRTWNTMASIDLNNTAYWSDYQTNEQYFGLLSFDPGKEQSNCYVDGDKTDWSEKDLVAQQEDFRLSLKYDEKFLYFLVEKQGLNLATEPLYIPIDTTPKSGATRADNLNLSFSHPSDFVIELHGADDSRVWVQERYDTATALYGSSLYPHFNPYENPPKVDSPQFHKVSMLLQDLNYYINGVKTPFSQVDLNQMRSNKDNYTIMQSYETGKLTYGNANPKSEEFNSLADFCSGDGFVEVKIPWQLLNFADPIQMAVHSDYYEHYGVEYLRIKSMNLGLGSGEDTIQMVPFTLTKQSRKPEYHERLKESYYILQDHWRDN